MPLEIVKVCGITNAGDARFAAKQGANAVGLIFYPGSPRCVTPQKAAMIAAVLPKTVLRVGVFVDEEPARIRKIAARVGLDVVQLHGNETPAVCRDLSGLRIWKAFRVAPGFDVDSLKGYPCEAYFLDAASNGAYGGTGRTFPWSIAVEAKRHGRVILAGGLDRDNVGEALRQVAPHGVDASSRLEREPGLKDRGKVKTYLEAALSGKDG